MTEQVHQAAGAFKTKIDKFFLAIVKIGELHVAGTSQTEFQYKID